MITGLQTVTRRITDIARIVKEELR